MCVCVCVCVCVVCVMYILCVHTLLYILYPVPGFFMEPTIFTEVEDHMFVAKEESFGPVMIISVFEDG